MDAEQEKKRSRSGVRPQRCASGVNAFSCTGIRNTGSLLFVQAAENRLVPLIGSMGAGGVAWLFSSTQSASPGGLVLHFPYRASPSGSQAEADKEQPGRGAGASREKLTGSDLRPCGTLSPKTTIPPSQEGILLSLNRYQRSIFLLIDLHSCRAAHIATLIGLGSGNITPFVIDTYVYLKKCTCQITFCKIMFLQSWAKTGGRAHLCPGCVRPAAVPEHDITCTLSDSGC